MNGKKPQKKVTLHRKKNSEGKVELLIVEVNIGGCIEKRLFADEKAAYGYIETLKKDNNRFP